MGVPEARLLSQFALRPKTRALAQGGPAAAPVQQIVHRFDGGAADIRTLLPVPTHSEARPRRLHHRRHGDRAKPKTGVQNVSINRIQIHGPDRLAS